MPAIDVEKRGKAVILKPHGGLIGGDLTERLENAIDEAFDGGCPNLVLDFSDVENINSIGMAAVIRAHAASRKCGSKFAVCCARERIRSAFEITRITTLGILRDTLEEALDGS